MKKLQIISKSKRLTQSLLAACAILFFPSIYAKTTPIQSSPYPLDKQIQDLVEKTVPNTHMGMMIMDANTGRILYQHHGYEHFTPASTTKLFTAAAALYYLKPDYRYKTAVYIDQQTPLHAELPGNIYIRFSGDPSLTEKNIATLIQQVRAKGIQQIKGNVILDTHVFSGSVYPQGITLRDTQWSYGAPVTSVIINRNGTPISITPSTTLKKPVAIKISGHNQAYFPLHNTATTVTTPDAERSCEFNVVMSDTNKVNIDGCWPINTQAYKKIAIINPTQFTVQLIKKFLKKEHIQLSGTIKTGTLPKQHTLLVKHLSNPMSSLVSHMLHFSDNLYANAFIKTLSVHNGGKGDFLNGLQVLKNILSQHTDINFNHMVLFDGAGLSAYNLITPYQMNQLLYAVYKSPDIKTTFLSALAEPNENGTLSQRMHTFGLSDNLQAKTGSMAGTSTLVGYLIAEDNHTLIFAMMLNNYVGDINNIRTLEDQLVAMLRNTQFKMSNKTNNP